MFLPYFQYQQLVFILGVLKKQFIFKVISQQKEQLVPYTATIKSFMIKENHAPFYSQV